MKWIALLATAVAVAGCSSSGPFVTSISSDGQGGLNVTSCMSTYNGVTGTQGNGECTSSHVQIISKGTVPAS